MASCHIKRIVEAIPTAHTVVLPDTWFESLPSKVSVYATLYTWLVETRHVKRDLLHDRTFVGATVARQLRAAERKRIAKVYKWGGERLETAVRFADGASGPHEMFADLYLLGKMIVVVPDDYTTVEDARGKIWNEHRLKEIRVIRRRASGANFAQWLVSNEGRNDAVGHLAGDVVSDEDFPQSIMHYQEAWYYIEQRRAVSADLYGKGVLGALTDAWKEYAAKYPERVVHTAWCDQCESEIVDMEKGVVLWDEDSPEFTVCHEACLRWSSTLQLNLQHLFAEDPSLEGLMVLLEPYQPKPSVRAKALLEHYHLKEPDPVEQLKERFWLWGFRSSPSLSQEKVYFIQSGTSGPIKIGYSATSVEQRLRSLQTGNQESLRLLAVMDGDRTTETALHTLFRAHRLAGEWFESHPALLAFIAAQEGSAVLAPPGVGPQTHAGNPPHDAYRGHYA